MFMSTNIDLTAFSEMILVTVVSNFDPKSVAFLVYIDRVRAVDRHCRKMRQKYKCGARFFHLAKVHGDNFLSSNLNSTY